MAVFQRRGSIIGRAVPLPTEPPAKSAPVTEEWVRPTTPVRVASQLTANQPGGEWLVGPPTSVGRYWYCSFGGKRIDGPAEVVDHPIVGLACLIKTGNGVSYKPVHDFARQWAGPLPYPPSNH